MELLAAAFAFTLIGRPIVEAFTGARIVGEAVSAHAVARRRPGRHRA